MKRTWKHVIVLDTLVLSPEVVVRMPRNAVILSVGVQPTMQFSENVVVWEMHDQEDEVERQNRKLLVLMTGQDFNVYGAMNFIGTVILRHGTFVLHVFEVMA